MLEREEKLNSLALDVLKLSRNTLLVNLRFLDMALNQFTYHPVTDNTLLTDGKYLLYDPKHVLSSYKLAKEIPVRDYLHMVMHCVFRHMCMDPTLNRFRSCTSFFLNEEQTPGVPEHSASLLYLQKDV